MQGKLRQEHRRDEQSLYYIIERDLDSGALFRYCNAWLPQVRVGGNVLDFVVQYGSKLIAIEVKFAFPRKKDFEQVCRYSEFVDGVYLAYPSDWAGEAILLDVKQSYSKVGIISIALFRSHIIRHALLEDRTSDEIWNSNNYYFNPKVSEKYYIERRRKLKNNDRVVLSFLKERKLRVAVGPDGKYRQNETFYIPVKREEWRSVAILFVLTEVKGSESYHDFDELRMIAEKFKWRISFDLVLSAGLVDYYSYGTNQTTIALTDAAWTWRDELEKALKEELGNDWQKLEQKKSEMKAKFNSNQEEELKKLTNRYTIIDKTWAPSR